MNQIQLRDVHLYRMDLPDHACPWGLKARQLLQDQGIPFTDHPLTSQAAVQAFKQAHQVATTPQIFMGTERIGGYTDLAARLQVKAEAADYSYTPVVAVFGTALLVDGAIGGGVMGFMGLALAMLAMLKLMDVGAFASSFLKYDLISQRWPLYARLYPGLEHSRGAGLPGWPCPSRHRPAGLGAGQRGHGFGLQSGGDRQAGAQLRLRRRQFPGATWAGELQRKPDDGGDGNRILTGPGLNPSAHDHGQAGGRHRP